VTLRVKALQGGAYLAFREGIGVFVRLGGILALTRILGPTDYGLYAGAAAISYVIITLAQMGLEVYLIRQPDEPSKEDYDRTFTFLLATSAAICAATLAFTWTLGPILMDDRFMGPLRLILISVPINVVWVPAQAILERDFQYRRLAIIELAGDFMLYIPSIALAAIGFGVNGPIIGTIIWQTWILVTSFYFARYWPRLVWSSKASREMARFGAGYSTASWLSRAEGLISPLIVGNVLGPAGVGVVALTQRIADALSILQKASWRLAIVAFSKIQNDLPRVRRALDEAMTVQILFFGPMLAIFGAVAVWVVPFVFGHRWDQALDIFPFVAVNAIGVSVLSAQAAVFFARGQTANVSRVNFAKLVIAAGTAAVLVPLLGLPGYGLALVLSLAALFVSDRLMRPDIKPSYGPAAMWSVAFIPPVFSPLLAPGAAAFLWVPTLLVLITPRAREQLREYTRLILSGVRKRRAVPAAA
jgi:O-antigen/teichoic acid export membrane protein